MLCGALKETDRLRGAVVILVVVWGVGVSGAGRMRMLSWSSVMRRVQLHQTVLSGWAW